MRRRACETLPTALAGLLIVAGIILGFVAGFMANADSEQRTAVKEGRGRWVADNETGNATFEWCKCECEGSK